MSATYSDAMLEAEGYIRWVIDQFRPWLGQRVMEVGLGHGGYYRHLPPMTHYCGVDIDPAVIDLSRKMHPGNDYRLLDVTSEHFADSVKDMAPDTILCFNVLEHIDNDRLAVERMVEALPDGGHLHLFVPAHESLFNDMDRLAGHFRRYNKTMMRTILPGKGVEVVKFEYFNPVGGLGWWVNRFTRHDSLNSAGIERQIRLYEKYLLPVSKFLNPVFRACFGQSLLIIVKKAESCSR